jgi:hypothetical protein
MLLLSKEKILTYLLPLLALIMMMVWLPRFKPAGKLSEKDLKLAEISDKDREKIDMLLALAGRKQVSSKSAFEEWGRNPFYQSKAIPAVNELEMWPLKGVIYNEETPSALIGDEIFVVGDKLGPFTITNIQPNMVVISDGHKVIKLQVQDAFEPVP